MITATVHEKVPPSEHTSQFLPTVKFKTSQKVAVARNFMHTHCNRKIETPPKLPEILGGTKMG